MSTNLHFAIGNGLSAMRRNLRWHLVSAAGVVWAVGPTKRSLFGKLEVLGGQIVRAR